jgi:hypothetical protein
MTELKSARSTLSTEYIYHQILLVSEIQGRFATLPVKTSEKNAADFALLFRLFADCVVDFQV